MSSPPPRSPCCSGGTCRLSARTWLRPVDSCSVHCSMSIRPSAPSEWSNVTEGGVSMANRQPDVPEMFREVFDLADKLVERITDTDVEARLRRLLEDRGVSRQASAELTAPEPCPS